ncbi:hypothetical protein ABPG72_008193 [Tetrahymena utriculariae]
MDSNIGNQLNTLKQSLSCAKQEDLAKIKQELTKIESEINSLQEKQETIIQFGYYSYELAKLCLDSEKFPEQKFKYEKYLQLHFEDHKEHSQTISKQMAVQKEINIENLFKNFEKNISVAKDEDLVCINDDMKIIESEIKELQEEEETLTQSGYYKYKFAKLCIDSGKFTDKKFKYEKQLKQHFDDYKEHSQKIFKQAISQNEMKIENLLNNFKKSLSVAKQEDLVTIKEELKIIEAELNSFQEQQETINQFGYYKYELAKICIESGKFPDQEFKYEKHKSLYFKDHEEHSYTINKSVNSEENIENLLNMFKISLSTAKEEDLANIKKELTKIELQINKLQEKEDTIKQFGYYKYELAKICKESSVFSDQKFKYERQLQQYFDDHQKYSQAISKPVQSEVGIENQLNAFQNFLKEEDLAKVKEKLKIIESEINRLQEKEETINQFGYYMYELAKICNESGRFDDQKFNYERQLRQYLIDHQEYSQTITKLVNCEQSIENQLNTFKNFLSIDKAKDLDKVKEKLKIIESEINSLQDKQETINQFGYYKYMLAKICIESGKFDDQKFKYERQLQQNEEDHQKYAQVISKSDVGELDIKNQLNAFVNFLSIAKEENLPKINEELKKIELQINRLQEKKETIQQFGCYKYELAKICIESDKLHDQKFKYERHLKQYFGDYQQYSQAISQPVQSILNLENQLYTDKRSLSINKKEELTKIKQQTAIIKSEINNLQEQKNFGHQQDYPQEIFKQISQQNQNFTLNSTKQNLINQNKDFYNSEEEEKKKTNIQQEQFLLVQNALNIENQLDSDKRTLSKNKEKEISEIKEQTAIIKSEIKNLQGQKNFNNHQEHPQEITLYSTKQNLTTKNKDCQNSEEENKSQESQKEKFNNKQVNEIYEKTMKIYYLVLGNTGDGKSTFIKKVTGNTNVQISNLRPSHTQECKIFVKGGKHYIDTPGINDTVRDRYDILLTIVKFLFNQELKVDNLFILLIQNGDLKTMSILKEFSYTYFLYEIFDGNIDQIQVKNLFEEYCNSKQLLNWSEVGLNDKKDDLSEKRNTIFQHKDKALNYFDYIYTYHIRILTFFDKKKSKMDGFDNHQMKILKQQIWSDQNQNQKFKDYNNYIQDQETHLLKKIEAIQKLVIYNNQLEENKEFQNILLIGKSQVGKSSMIEQLTKLVGLRGTGEISETQICRIYRVDYGNVIYRFIDTPGYDGTENNQVEFHNLKVIADYLKRKNINEFKLLVMINKDLDTRDTLSQILKEFLIFIENIFNQDVSFEDTDYLKNLFQTKQQTDQERNMILLKNKILQIFRLESVEDFDPSQEKFEYTIFNSNYFTTHGELKQIKKEDDQVQQKQLFEKINNIENIGLEDKVIFRIQKSLLKNIISKPDHFMQEFKKLAGLYLNFSEIGKLKMAKELRDTQFHVVESVYSQASQQIKESQFSEKVKNDALRHFLPILYPSILFEIIDDKPESMLISRKQHYYSLLAHQLSKFINLNNEKHRKLLENLAEIKLAQEISNQNIEHQQYIETNYQKKPEENLKQLQKLSEFLITLQNDGLTFHKSITFISLLIRSLLTFSVGFIIDAFLFPIFLGYDIKNLYKGYICSNQFKVNSATYLTSAACLSLFLIPGIGWIAGIVSGVVLVIGNGLSSYFFTSCKTFDQTIGIYLHKIIQDIQPNQNLMYYERSQLLQEKFKVNNYSQLKQKLGYDMFRELEKDKFNQNKYLLTQLYKPQNSEDLKDLISKYISTNYILRDIQETEQYIYQYEDEKNENYQKRIIQLLQKNKELIKTFYNKLNEGDTITKKCEQLIDLLKKKFKEDEKQDKNIQETKINFSKQEELEISYYINLMKIFYEENSKQDKTTYENQCKLADGILRKDGRFQILFNSYCNLAQLKAEQKLKQPTIREIVKEKENMKFVVKIQNKDQNQKDDPTLKQNEDNKFQELNDSSKQSIDWQKVFLMEIQIENQLNTFKEYLSFAKDEDLAQIKEKLTVIESKIDGLQEQEKTITQFGYYKYELAKLCIESSKFLEQKFKYEKYLKSYFGDHQYYSQTIIKQQSAQNEVKIQNQLNTFKKSLSIAKEEDLAIIKKELTTIESEINSLQEKEETINQFGYYKYELAKLCIDSGKFSDQKFKYDRYLIQYFDDHQEHSQIILRKLLDQNKIIIENQLKTFKNSLSISQKEDLTKIKEQITVIESEIDKLEEKEETIHQFGYYKYELAKICTESGKLHDQKFKYERYLKQYLGDHQKHSQAISQPVQSILNLENQLYSDQRYLSVNKKEELSKIKEQTAMIKSEINNLQEQNNFDHHQERSQEMFKQMPQEPQKLTFDSTKQNLINKNKDCQNSEEEKKSQESQINIQQECISEQEKFNNKQVNEIYEKNMKIYYLVLGNTGEGKSSFIKKVTGNTNVQISNARSSHTQECKIFVKGGKHYIDTPGINDTVRDRYDILLIIVKFLFNQKLQLDNLFILLIQKEDLKTISILKEFSYTYFLYEIFDGNIDQIQLKNLFEDYCNSKQLLNWSEVGLHDKKDDLSEKRKKIFQHKDKALNYFEYIYTYYIRVLTFFDKKKSEMDGFDNHQMKILKQQIWSDQNQNQKFKDYNNYIQDQETHLLKKIEAIQKLVIYNNQLEENKEFQNILLIGKSQVGKSSMIEQLTKLVGLRGTGEISETQICRIYRVDYGNVIYRFIDTPGYDGTENDQVVFHNFKIIADYLRRQGINEFKLLIMINKDLDTRDTLSQILNEFFIFIENVFDQDVSFVDTDYLQSLLTQENEKTKNKIIFKDKILQIFRLESEDDFDPSQEQFEYTIFNSNYFTTRGELKQIKKQKDQFQQKQLFEKINNIEYIGLEDKAIFGIQKSLSKNIISKPDEFNDKFDETANFYQKLSQIDSQISEKADKNNQSCSGNNFEIKQLKKDKLIIAKQLKYSKFYVVGSLYKQITPKVKQSQHPIKVKNNTLRHFLPIQYTSILFEITEDKPESIFISRRQHYYSLLAHQLSKFINLNNEKHRQLLENLAELKLAQEICNQNIEHQKYIDNNFEKNPEENIEELQKISCILNYFKSNGITIHKNITYVSLMIKYLTNFSFFGISFSYDVFLTPLLFGYDIIQKFKGFMPSKQFKLNTTTNILIYGSIALNAVAVGQFAFLISGFVLLTGYGLSSYFFTSKLSFDSTIAQYLRNIVNDLSPNQHLRYYESSQLLKKHFGFTNYSQLEEKIGYDMFRQLEKDNFNEQILTQLFKPQGNQNLKDLVSKYIVTNFILKAIQEQQKQIQQNDFENNEQYLVRVVNLLQKIKQQIETFYNRSNSYDKIIKLYEELTALMKKKHKEEQKTDQNNKQKKINFSSQEVENINYFQKTINIFCEENSKQDKITYENQCKLADGYFRQDDRFKILYNSYCNLTQLKAAQKLQQPTIREIEKDKKNMKFVVKIEKDSQKQHSYSILSQNKDNELPQLLDLFCNIDKYIVNRYLQQTNKEDKPNLTSLAQNEIIDTSLSFSKDLHDVFENSGNEQAFLEKLRDYSQDNDMHQRLKQFYKSVEYLRNYFNSDENKRFFLIEIQIENQLNAFKKYLSFAKDEDLAQIKEKLTVIESKIDDFQQQEETIIQFGYYTYELAKLCIESGKFLEKKFKYEKYLKQYIGDHQYYSQTIIKQLSAQNELNKKIQLRLRKNQQQSSEIGSLQEKEETINQFGYYKYELAKLCINSGKFSDKKFNYDRYLIQYFDDHQEYSQIVLRQIIDQNNIIIENQLNTFKKYLSISQKEDLIKIKEEITVIESEIDKLQEKKETIHQFGYYKYELAKICTESGKLHDQKFKYERYLKQYLGDHQKHSQVISLPVQSVVNIKNQLYTDQRSLSVNKKEELSKIKEQTAMIKSQINNLQEQKKFYHHQERSQEMFKQMPQQPQKLTFNSTIYNLINKNKDCQNSEEEKKSQESQINIQQECISEQEKFNNKQLNEIYENNMKIFYLVLGNTGDGKSSFIKKVTGNTNVQTSYKKSSNTQECKIFVKGGKHYIDTPGINHTVRDRYDILLTIVKFLFNPKLQLGNLFILLTQKEDLKTISILKEFSYTYFLYEIFDGNIDQKEAKNLFEEYCNSKQLLNWSGVGFHDKKDDLYEKRKKIFQHKDKALNYFEYIYTYHIRVLTFFDKKKSEMERFDDHRMNILKQQIQSDQNQNQKFIIYNQQLEENKEFQNILLIGRSQVEKSSMIEQLTKLVGLRGAGEISETQICTTYRVDYGNVIYRFIDTPGYDGTENDQVVFHNFKIIADYLRKQDINEFKLLVMINKDLDTRDKLSQILNEFFIFIENFFDQHVSFVDTDYLKSLLTQEIGKKRNKIMFKDKILQIFDQNLKTTLIQAKNNLNTQYLIATILLIVEN